MSSTVINKDTFVVTLSPFTNPQYYSEIRLQNPPTGYNYYSVYSTHTVNLLNNFSKSSLNIDKNGKSSYKNIISTAENDSIVYKHTNVYFNGSFLQIVQEDIPKLNNQSVSLVFSFFVESPPLLYNLQQQIITVFYNQQYNQFFDIRLNNFKYVKIYTDLEDKCEIIGLVDRILDLDGKPSNSIISNNCNTVYECKNIISNINIIYNNPQKLTFTFTFLFF